jgi:hypothetical protein
VSTETKTYETIDALRADLPNLPESAKFYNGYGAEYSLSDVRAAGGGYAPYTVTYETPETVTIDPAAVKAGDEVTVRVEADPKSGGTFEVTGKAYMNYGPFGGAGVMHVGRHSLDGYNVTITTHTPAPKPEPEPEPGTFGTAYFIGWGGHAEDTGMRAVRIEHHPGSQWDYALLSPLAGATEYRRLFKADEVFRFVPDEDRPKVTRDQVVRTLDDLGLSVGDGTNHDFDVAVDALMALFEGN